MRLRPIVHDALRAIMVAQHQDEAGAYGILCRMAMQRRLTIEHIAASIVAGHEPIPEAG